jgi:hypothetical protein
VREAEWPQQHGVDDAEDGRRCADAERQGRNGDDGEGATLGEGARAVPDVLRERIEPAA